MPCYYYYYYCWSIVLIFSVTVIMHCEYGFGCLKCIKTSARHYINETNLDNLMLVPWKTLNVYQVISTWARNKQLYKINYNGQQIDAIVMDFSKAFDKVAHSRLVYTNSINMESVDTLWNGLRSSFLSDHNVLWWKAGNHELHQWLQGSHRIQWLVQHFPSVHQWSTGTGAISDETVCWWHNYLP